MSCEFKTVLNPAVAEIEEKKSRFISSIKPISDEEEAIKFINSLKSKYWDATHNVYAYSICGDNIIQRFSDDGEPSGTAGLPVLEVIKKIGVQNVVVVVTRYFGGTLLGSAGLIRAYGKSASCAVDKATVVVKKQCVKVSIVLDYTLLGKVQSLLINRNFIIKEIIYKENVEIVVYIPVGETESFHEIIVEATNAKAYTRMGEKEYIIVDNEGKFVSQ